MRLLRLLGLGSARLSTTALTTMAVVTLLRLFGSTRGAATTIVVLWVPAVLVPTAIAAFTSAGYPPETIAALACYLILVPFVVFPVVVVLAYRLAPRRVSHSIAELCTVWVLWNSHVIGFGSLLLLFLVPSYLTRQEHLEVLYDYGVFMLFVVAPLIIVSGGFKFVATRKRWGWSWPQRAITGAYCLLVTLCMWVGQAYVRPHAVPTTMVACAIFYAYACTYLPPHPNASPPEVSGAREWPWFREAGRPIWNLAIDYLQLRLVIDGADDAAAPPAFAAGRATVAGFHPHGIIPYASGLLAMTAEWRAAFGDVRPHMMTDFMTHLLPLMRDLIHWLGGREVSKESIRRALRRREVVMLVPGGQAEIFTTRSWGTRVYLYRAHKGFVRLALQHRARLVPLLSMGEWQLMDNVSWPRTQALSRRLLGFPFPFAPYGAYFLPIPRRPRHGLTILIGRPIDYECAQLPEGAAPSDEEVDRAHKLYFDEVRRLFEKYKASCGYPDHQLVFLDSKEQVAQVGLHPCGEAAEAKRD